jgi:hypothetical protein
MSVSKKIFVKINKMFKKKIKLTFFAALISVVCFGCSGNSESNSAKNNNGNQSTAPINKPANLQPTVAGSNLPATDNSAVNINKGAKTPPAANQPTPKIGSGGDDLALFAQARSAFSSDPELLNGVIIEIKEGNATLSGKVPSEEKKKKAEQLVQNINGIKSVKNNIGVSKK